MNRLLFAGTMAAVVFGGSMPAFAADCEPGGGLCVRIEEPASGDIKTGVSTIRGWAVSTAGISLVELWVDDMYWSTLPMGGARPDICATYDPAVYPGACESGFSVAVNFGELAAGSHTVDVYAIDGDFGEAWRSVQFEVTRFPNSFIPSADRVSLAQSFPYLVSDNQFILGCIWVDGDYYDVQLVWDRRKQDWKSEIIANSNLDCPPGPGLHENTWLFPGP